jgi:hypothetical protein
VGRCAQHARVGRVARQSPVHGVRRIVSTQSGAGRVFFPGELVRPYDGNQP